MITGVGVVSPFGDARDAFRDALIAGRTGIAVAPEFAAAGCRTTLAARVGGFDPAKWVAPMKLRRMDVTGPFALAAIQQAIDQAGYSSTSDGDDRAGVVLGTYSAGGQATSEYLDALFSGGPTGAPALLFNSTVGNAAAGLAGLEFKLRGPNVTISQKEASGLAAIATAADLLRAGRADAIAAGGVDAVFEIFFRTHDTFEVMSPSREPDDSLAPFGRRRAGFVLGEGAFVLWLERGESGRGRATPALGEILGIGLSGAPGPLNAWPADPAPIVRAMALALDDAGVAAAEVDVVYASANASAALDEVEAQALTSVFDGTGAVVTSIKGAIGESGAAGAAGCVAAIVCGADGRVPPIAGFAEPDAGTRGLRLVSEAMEGAGPIALVNSVASGGAIVSLVLRVGARVPSQWIVA